MPVDMMNVGRKGMVNAIMKIMWTVRLAGEWFPPWFGTALEMNDDGTIPPRTIQISLRGRTGGGRNHWNSQQRRHMLRHKSQERRRTHIEAYDLREKIHLRFMIQERRPMLGGMS